MELEKSKIKKKKKQLKERVCKVQVVDKNPHEYVDHEKSIPPLPSSSEEHMLVPVQMAIDCEEKDSETKQTITPIPTENISKNSVASNELQEDLMLSKVLQTNQTLLASIRLEDVAGNAITTAKPIANAIRPYTESQLEALYTNNELNNVVSFVQEFVEVELKSVAVKRHRLFELLEHYLQVRNKMISCSLEIKQHQEEYNELQNQLWSLESFTLHGQAVCQDGITVKTSHTGRRAIFHRPVFQTVERLLNVIGEEVNAKSVLYSYSAQVVKLQIDLLVTTLMTKCFNITGSSTASPVLLRTLDFPPNVNSTIDELRLAISVLFSFQRRLIRDLEFVKEVREWLQKLVSVLLRIGSWQDHFLILNHVLRCPPGVSSWATNFIQVPLENNLEESPFSSHHVNHLISVLKVIMMPIHSRERFLTQFMQTRDTPGESLWVFVDSEGEEDEDSNGLTLRENDLVQMFNQIPFANLFRNIMLIRHQDHLELYNPSELSENHILRFLAFNTVFLKILSRGLETYSQVRYKQFSKRICRLIRYIVQFVTDQWEAVSKHNESIDMGMKQRLKVEHDEFCFRAVHCLYSSKNAGSWQYLTFLPYHVVEISTIWKMFCLLHNNLNLYESNVQKSMDCNLLKDMLDESFRAYVEEQLLLMDEGESYYLLNTLANMALARKDVDTDFITTVTLDLLQIGFVNESSRETCSKNVRILLAQIASKFPHLQSFILKCVKKHIITIGYLAMELFEELPLSIWEPKESDIDIIEVWLLQNDISAIENQLSRMIISRLNWDIRDDQTHFLPYKLHVRIALLAAQMYDQDCAYSTWAWQTVFRLKLHMCDSSYTLNLNSIAELENVDIINKGVREQKSLHCFLALAMTTWGHLVPLICTKGLNQLDILYNHQRYDAILLAMNFIVPIFLECAETLINSDKFQTILINLIHTHMDRGYIAMAISLVAPQYAVLEQFGNMITFHISNFKQYNLTSPRYIVRFWMNTLVSVPDWNKEYPVLYLLDVLIKGAFCHIDAMNEVHMILQDLLQCLIPQNKSGSISSVFKWVSPSPSPHGSLLTATSLPDCVWLAFVLITVEYEVREKDTGLWREILTQIRDYKRKINIDSIIKNAANVLKIPSFSSSSLCFYRFAQQALDTPVEHPLLPLLWQRFFSLYLMRIPSKSNSGTVCVGEKFFDGIINYNFQKRLKKRLQETVEFYRKNVSDCAESHLYSKQEYYSNCLKLFQAYSLWLDEQRLQEVNLHLSNLPPQYEPQLLLLIMQENMTPWFHYIDNDKIKVEQEKMLRNWRMSIFREKGRGNQPLGGSTKSDSGDPIERIACRLRCFDDPKCPPVVGDVTPIVSSIAINSESEMFQIVKPNVHILVQFCRNYITQLLECKTLNSSYKSLIPLLYRSIPISIRKQVSCQRPNNIACTGPAIIILEIQEAKFNDAVNHQIERNRSDYNNMVEKLMQVPANSLCLSSLIIQNVIDILKEMAVTNPIANELAVKLFYFILSLINEDTKIYPPTKYFFSLCIDKIGQAFIGWNQYETAKLLNKILEEPQFIEILVPYFCPENADTATFLEMYESIVKNIDQLHSVSLHLLPKFDILNWMLTRNPSILQRNKLINTIIHTLTKLGIEQHLELEMIHSILRKHLLRVFEYRFPEHYGHVLVLLLEASSDDSNSNSISISTWIDILNSLSKPIMFNIQNHMKEYFRQYGQQQTLLCYHELFQTAKLLSDYFSKERLQLRFGLYPKYTNYVDTYCTFLGMTGHALIIAAVNIHPGLMGEKLCEKIWPILRDMFAPWIVPYWIENVKTITETSLQGLPNDNEILLPCITTDAAVFHKMMAIMVDCIYFVNDTLPASNILSCVWHWYVTNFALHTMPEYILNVVYTLFITLPWSNFWPLYGDLELMLKITEQHLPQCHSFLGHIFMQVPWPTWIAHTTQNATSQVLKRMKYCLLHLLVKLCYEPKVRLIHGEKARTFLVQAEHFNWVELEPTIYQQICDWFVMSCDPLVLLKSDPLDIDFRILHFLKVVACYDQPIQTNLYNALQRRHIFVKSYLKLFSILGNTCRKSIASKQKELTDTINCELKHIETVVILEDELKIIFEEFFVILNINEIQGIAVSCIEDWLALKSADSIILRTALQTIGVTVSDINVVAKLYETLIFVYFSTGSRSVVSWNYLKDMIQVLHFKQPELEKVAVDSGKLLFLFALLLHKVSDCADSVFLLNLMIKWLSEVKLCPEKEDILPLYWSQFLKVALLLSSSDHISAATALHKLAQLLFELSLDKGISGWGKGLLGAIGIVKQDSNSIKFRFLCRAISGYIFAQLPNPKGSFQTVRLAENDSCGVGQAGGSSDCVKVLQKLDFGENQGEIKTYAELALKQIKDPKNSLHNSRRFLSMLVERLYTRSYLREIESI